MSYYLIDFENVKSRGMEGVELLAEEDVVCIFYSDNADSMTFDLHRKLNETKAQIIYHKVAVGTKNALDFQLATYLGYLICEQQREGIHPNYYIVTKDNGFTSLMVYWKAQGVPVRIIRNLLWGKNPEAAATEAAVEATAETTQLSAEEPEENIAVTLAEEVAQEQDTADSQNQAAVTETEAATEPTSVPKTVEAEAGDIPENVTAAGMAASAAPAKAELEEPVEKVSAQEAPEPEAAEEPVKKPRKKSASRKTSQKNTAKKEDKKKAVTAEEPDELTQAVGKVLSDQTIVPQVVKFIRQYKTKQGINNALNKEFKDSKRTSEIYSAIKPLIADKKGK